MYPMNVSCLLNKLCNEINAELARFWWLESNKQQGIHWINWAERGQAKTDEGMGFRNLKDFNIALLAKQCWRLIHDPNSL